MYLDFLFSVHTIQKKKKTRKKKTQLLKNIFNTNKLNIRHSKQMCDLLEDSFAQSGYWCALATRNSYDLETELQYWGAVQEFSTSIPLKILYKIKASQPHKLGVGLSGNKAWDFREWGKTFPSQFNYLYREIVLPLFICRDYHYSRYCNVNRYGIFLVF